MNNSQIKATKNAAQGRGRKLDLGIIAEVMALETNGFISKDLYDALKMAEAAGLCTEDKPLPEVILWEDRELDYDAEKLSKEADCVLLLRTKAGDDEAFAKLFNNKKNMLLKIANTYSKKYMYCESALEREFDFYEQEVYISFLNHILQNPVCSHEKILFSHTNIEYTLRDNIDKQYQTSTSFVNFGSTAYNASKIKKQMESCDIDVKDVTFEQFADFCKEQGIGETAAKRMFEAQHYIENERINNYSSKKRGTCEDCHEEISNLDKENRSLIADVSNASSSKKANSFVVNGRTYYDYDPANINFDNSEFIDFIIELRQDSKHGRDIETLLAHVMGEKNFDFSNMFAENADSRASLQETADLMGYETAYEVKLAMKRAKEFIISSMKKKYPEMLSNLTKDRKRAMA